MFPNLQKIAFIGLTLPVLTASVERSLSRMKLIKKCLRKSLTEWQGHSADKDCHWVTDILTEDEIEVI